ncbi:MAG TPA: hypothetical protein VFG15_30180 [Amycolatopsis sp.]|nr:hypothetical protein [Amycolatopsis sp.]
MTARPAVPRVWRTGDAEPTERGLRLVDSGGYPWARCGRRWACAGDDALATDWPGVLAHGPVSEETTPNITTVTERTDNP